MARILIADDDANFRSVLGSMLEDAGHEPGFATDGEQAIAIYDRGTFDLAIIDLVLPAKNGVQVIREILKLDPAAKLIAISGKEPAQLELAAEAGALRTLTKPFATEQLTDSSSFAHRPILGSVHLQAGTTMARILIADDDEVARLHMGSILEGAGHEVCYAVDGEQAVRRFEQGRHDLVLVDLAMPVKNGILAIREIRALDKFAKVIAVSGETPEQVEWAKQAGALQTLEKPVAADELLDAIATLSYRATGWDRVYG